MFVFISNFLTVDTGKLIFHFDANTIQGISQLQVNVFLINLRRAISAIEATGVLHARYDDLVNGSVGGALHFSTAPAILQRMLTSLQYPGNPVTMDSIALTIAQPGAPYVKSAILAQILA